MNQLTQLVFSQDVVVVQRLKQQLLNHNRLLPKRLLSDVNLAVVQLLVGIEEDQQQPNCRMWVSLFSLCKNLKKCFSRLIQGNRVS